MNFLLLFLLFILPLSAEVEVRPDKTSLTINQKLGVTLFFHEPIDLFPFLYELEQKPHSSFQLVDYSIVDSKTVHLTLAPMHTGTLIFAPGVVTTEGKHLLIPAFSVECTKVASQNLPFAGLLPLYPERRIELNQQNRLMLIDKKVLEEARRENEHSFKAYSMAWNGLAIFFVAIALGVVLVWVIIYYDLLDKARRPPPIKETRLQALIRELEDPEKAGWQTLANATREALQVKLDRDFTHMSLVEVSESVANENRLSYSDKELLIPFINSLGAICYAGRKASQNDLFDMIKKFLIWGNYGSNTRVDR